MANRRGAALALRPPLLLLLAVVLTAAAGAGAQAAAVGTVCHVSGLEAVVSRQGLLLTSWLDTVRAVLLILVPTTCSHHTLFLTTPTRPT